MTELRTTLEGEESLQLLHRMALIGRNINTAIRINTERIRESVLVSVQFPASNELELFLAALPEWDIELKKWAKYDFVETGNNFSAQA
jgi:hypothetical protein